MTDEIISYEQLPLTLKADQVAAVLGISRANAYTLLRREDFPTLRIGKRMLVPRDRFVQWIEENTQKQGRS
jgi:excisionase family DNA binding protein